MDDGILEALKCAKYNEIVTIHVADADDVGDETNEPANINTGRSTTNEILLVARLDDEQGGVMWNDLFASWTTETDDKVTVACKRHLQTKRWVFPMLNDSVRNEFYDKAIQQATERVVATWIQRRNASHIITTKIINNINNNNNDSSCILPVLDIGSGTGLLAMMATKHLKDHVSAIEPSCNIRVTSVEMSSAMTHLAERIVQSNDMQSYIQILEGHSCDIPPCDPKALLCTSELLESGLLGEGWLIAMRDAWERHLDDDAIVVPQRARVYAQVVQGRDIDDGGSAIVKYWGPHGEWLSGFPHDRMLRLCTSSADEEEGLDFMLDGNDGIHFPLHVANLWKDITPLSDPFLVLEIDVSTRHSLPNRDGCSKTKTFVPTATGAAEGILFWWELDLWDGLTYSTQSGNGPWQDHWHQCLFVFTRPTNQLQLLREGIEAFLTVSHNDSGISFSMVGTEVSDVSLSSDSKPSAKRQCLEKDVGQSLISPERAYQLNDKRRLTCLKAGLQRVLQNYGSNAVVLDLSDFSLCGIMAALLGAPNVTSLEASSGAIPLTAAKVAQLANGLPLVPDDPTSFQIVQCQPEHLSLEILGGKPANVVVGEPYYEVLEGWHLQEALNYFYLVRAMKRRGVISKEDATSVPSYAAIMGCAIQSTQLGQAYKGCASNLCGFHHGIVNQHGDRFHHYDLSLPMWQYEYTELTDSFELARLDYDSCEILNDRSVVKSRFRMAGSCHAILMWIDYGIPGQGESNVLSSKGRSYRQLVRMLPNPVDITDEVIETMCICCQILIGGLLGPDDYQVDISLEHA